MYNWQDYLSPQLPMQWQPNADYVVNEIANNLHGVLPRRPDTNLHPGELVLREVTAGR